jgi:ParB family chromosome partitioning protein
MAKRSSTSSPTASKPAPHGQHRSASPEWFTPPAIADAARVVLGGIDLDPASCAAANAVIRAARFLTKADNGFEQPWAGRVFHNPPSSPDRRPPLAAHWWAKLVTEWEAGAVPAAIFVGFNLDIIVTSQNSGTVSILDVPFCVPKSRLAFLSDSGGGNLVPQKNPTHPNVIAYLPDRRDPGAARRFRDVFSKFGKVVVPAPWEST